MARLRRSAPLVRRAPLRAKVGLEQSPLRRSSPLRNRSELRRASGLNPINRARKARLYERNFGEHGKWIRSLPCVLAGRGCWGAPVAAHAVARGMGGCKGSKRDLYPSCWGHNQQLEEVGMETFQRAYNIDLSALAADFWARSPHREAAP